MASRGGGGADQTAPSRAASASMSLGALSVLDASLVRQRDELALTVVDEDTEDPVSPGDGSVFERDYYELRLAALRRHQGRQPLRVQDVKVCINLVHDVERHRMDLLQSEKIADCRDRLLSTAGRGHRKLSLPGELEEHVEPALERIV